MERRFPRRCDRIVNANVGEASVSSTPRGVKLTAGRLGKAGTHDLDMLASSESFLAFSDEIPARAPRFRPPAPAPGRALQPRPDTFHRLDYNTFWLYRRQHFLVRANLACTIDSLDHLHLAESSSSMAHGMKKESWKTSTFPRLPRKVLWAESAPTPSRGGTRDTSIPIKSPLNRAGRTDIAAGQGHAGCVFVLQSVHKEREGDEDALGVQCESVWK